MDTDRSSYVPRWEIFMAKSPSGGFSSYVSIKELSLERGKDKLVEIIN